MPSNAEHLRAWLLGCGAIDASAPIGLDWQSGAPGGYALIALPTALRVRENILGKVSLRETQEEDFLFASREPCGADTAQNLSNAALYRAVTEWILGQNARGNLPAWEGGAVTGVLPSVTAAPLAWEPGVARYGVRIRVIYKTDA